MFMQPTIRAERDGDRGAIHDVICTAFAGMPYADGDEAGLVDTLRAEGALSVSLVAEVNGRIVGQIAFSPAQASDGSQGWYALGPVSVVPAHQRSGIGSTLVRAGLKVIRESGAVGCILTGNPAYYVRFGFAVSSSNAPDGEPVEFFMVKVFSGQQPKGPIYFHKAFHSAA